MNIKPMCRVMERDDPKFCSCYIKHECFLPLKTAKHTRLQEGNVITELSAITIKGITVVDEKTGPTPQNENWSKLRSMTAADFHHLGRWMPQLMKQLHDEGKRYIYEIALLENDKTAEVEILCCVG